MSDRYPRTNDPSLPRLARRAADSHKGDYGRCLIVGGSTGMTGAIVLAGLAALRSGAGLVRLATAHQCQSVVAGFEPSLMTLGLASDDDGRLTTESQAAIQQQLEWASVAACGPGLGRSTELDHLVTWLYRHAKIPMVFDADALFALAKQPGILAEHAAARVLTPHAGEFRRLLGREQPITEEERVDLARSFAARGKLVLVLKGRHTVVTDGERVLLNPTGNPGMATGGTGDVLTGVITSLMGQQLSPIDAAQVGAYVHGLAGDLAARELGERSLIASDVVRHLPAAFQTIDS